MGVLHLRVDDYEGPDHWRWELTRPGGAFVTDHDVRLDQGCWEYEAFRDLHGHIRSYAAPDRWLEDETEIVSAVGRWMGEHVLGPIGPALVKSRPATVRVMIPRKAAELAFCPLELAHVGGRPIALQDVTLVTQIDADPAGEPKAPVADRLRILGLFSVPVEGRPLNLRRERHMLVQLFEDLETTHGRAVDLRVLQYGATRDRLKNLLLEGEGWDIVHISGHGTPGELLLEKEDGTEDRMTAPELADLLDLARTRLKLVNISACWSAALTAESRRLLSLPDLQDRATDAAEPTPERPVAALATELVDRLDCSVLAMRYPVPDEFAIRLAEKLYGLIAELANPVDRALSLALRDLIETPPSAACPSLSVATPTLSGGTSVALNLAAPVRTSPESYDIDRLKMMGFPDQPKRFVGRVGVMARASAALAPRSNISAVLLHGMPGGGKSACALELAYTHEDVFDRLVWFKAPDEGREIAGALTDFAVKLESSLPGLQIVHLLEHPDRLRVTLAELCKRHRVLIILDNLESLLTGSGRWRDPRWGLVFAALTGHGGLSRSIMTTRRHPAELDASMLVAAIDALTLDEALLLTRELGHLQDLIDGTSAGVSAADARLLARRVLEVAQGHPQLLELANGQAADPNRLSEMLAAADQAWRDTADGLPAGFFTTGRADVSGADYLHLIKAWTRAGSAELSTAQRELFWFLCCLEESDRVLSVVAGNWIDLWRRLERPGEPPESAEVLPALIDSGLVTLQQEAEDAMCVVHPGVAAAGRGEAGAGFQREVDVELAVFWSGIAKFAVEREGQARTGEVVVRAGLSAAPYLLRLGERGLAELLLEQAITRDRSRAAAGRALPALRRIAEASAGTDDELPTARTLARALEVFDLPAAEERMRWVRDTALSRRDYAMASTTTANLINYAVHGGRLAEALELAQAMADYTRRAGLGPWNQLGCEVQRVQVLAAMGRTEQVLEETAGLRERMDALPPPSAPYDTAQPWMVRELLLDIGHTAARQAGRWQQALEFTAEKIASEQARGAPPAKIATTRFNAYYPLMKLNRIEQARRLLLDCRRAFERDHDARGLGKVFDALAWVEHTRGHTQIAMNLQHDTLRYTYQAGEVDDIAGSHHNLGNYLRDHAEDAAGALPHHLAAALITWITQGEGLQRALRAVAIDMNELGDTADIPAGPTQLCQYTDQIPGAALGRLLVTLMPDPAQRQSAWDDLLNQGRCGGAERGGEGDGDPGDVRARGRAADADGDLPEG